MTPLNGIVNDYLYTQGVDFEETWLDASDAYIVDLTFFEEFDAENAEFNRNLIIQHTLVTCIPIIIFIGIALAL